MKKNCTSQDDTTVYNMYHNKRFYNLSFYHTIINALSRENQNTFDHRSIGVLTNCHADDFKNLSV